MAIFATLIKSVIQMSSGKIKFVGICLIGQRMSTVGRRFKNTVEEVDYLLSRYPEARNNDFFLQWIWLKEIMGLNMPDLPWHKYQLYAGKLGTLRRIRQKVQATGKYLPSDKRVLETRQKRRRLRLAKALSSTDFVLVA